MPNHNPPEIVTIEDGTPVILPAPSSNAKDGSDSSWIRNAFMTRDVDIQDKAAKINRYWTTARSKFTDTSLGGNIGLNPLPQFTQYADIPVPGRHTGRQEATVANTSGDYGMGRYYSEAYDDTKHLIYLRFGVPQYNSLFRFFSLAIDRNAASIANTGKNYQVFEVIGQVLGTVLSLITIPTLAVLYWGIKGISILLPNASSKYYTLKPTPVLYYGAVSTLFNAMAINRGILPPSLMSEDRQEVGTNNKIDQVLIDHMRKLIPDVFTNDNYIDVYAIMGRAQRLANDQYDRELAEVKGGVDYVGYIDTLKNSQVAPIAGSTFEDLVKRTMEFNPSVGAANESLLWQQVTGTDGKKSDDAAETKATDAISKNVLQLSKDPLAYEEKDDEKGSPPEVKSWFENARYYYEGLRKDGADFLPLIVEHTGTVTESFSTTMKDNPVTSIVNSTSESARSVSVMLGGNPLGNNVIGEFVNTVVDSVAEVVMGTLSVFTAGTSNIIAALLGGGYIDVPKVWDNSTVSLPKLTYTINLTQPYGHPLSLLLHSDLIVSALLAGVMPLATGKASYTSPFICELIDPGRQQIPLGIIDSLTITRGTTNLGFNKENHALGIELSFSVLDLSSIMAMPVSDGSYAMTVDDDNILSKYISTLTGRSLSDQYYAMPAGKVRLSNFIFDNHAYNSPAGWAMSFNYSAVGRLINMFSARSDVIK